MLTAHDFDTRYASCSDPWHFKTSWYEIRKRALIMAALPHLHYHNAFEPGCSNGELTAQLATRCNRVYACDFSERILQQARLRLAHCANVMLTCATIPHEWPNQSFDLIVFNEIGYYLTNFELHITLDNIENSLVPGGSVVVCHWLGNITGCEIDGEFVHRVFTDRISLSSLLSHRENEFLLDVFSLAETPPLNRSNEAAIP